MSLFSEAEVRDLIAEFPDKPVQTVIAQIERKAKSQTITSPMGLAKAWLRKAKTIADESAAATSLPVRGTFREDGTWARDATIASEWEIRLIAAARDVRRGFKSPAEAVAVILEQGLGGMVRESTQAIWGRLDRIEAWCCAPTSTSAEQWFKTYVIGS